MDPVTAGFQFATKLIELILRLIEDQPPEERRKAWERWFRFWEPVWKLMGLDTTQGVPGVPPVHPPQ